jgi:hypothetical protein
MVAYCATTLQGATCINNRCPYSHDVFYCQPCGRSFPASLLVQHERAQQHLRNVASNASGSSVPSTLGSPLSQSLFSDLLSAPTSNTSSRPSGRNTPVPSTPLSPRLSQSQFSDLLSAPPANTSRLPWRIIPVPSPPRSPPISQSQSSDLSSAPSENTSQPSERNTPTANVDPRVTVSDEDGLDFVAEGTGTAANPKFPSFSRTIVIKKTDLVSNLTVQSMKLTPSPNPWYKLVWLLYSGSHVFPDSFVARLLGKTNEVQKGTARKIEMTFKARRGGTFHGVLSITFRDEIQSDQEFTVTQFTVTRELHGRAILIGQPSSPEPSNKAEGDVMKSGRDCVTVSHDPGIEFSVERSRVDEPFANQTKELVITKTSDIPLVSLKVIRVRSIHGSLVG